MGITYKVTEKTTTVVDIEMETPSVQHHGYGASYADLFQLIGTAKGEFAKRSGKPAIDVADNDIQVFVGDDKIVLRFWIEKEEKG